MLNHNNKVLDAKIYISVVEVYIEGVEYCDLSKFVNYGKVRCDKVDTMASKDEKIVW